MADSSARASHPGEVHSSPGARANAHQPKPAPKRGGISQACPIRRPCWARGRDSARRSAHAAPTSRARTVALPTGRTRIPTHDWPTQLATICAPSFASFQSDAGLQSSRAMPWHLPGSLGCPTIAPQKSSIPYHFRNGLCFGPTDNSAPIVRVRGGGSTQQGDGHGNIKK